MEELAAAGIDRVTGEEHHGHLGVIECIEGILAQESDCLELVGRLPGLFPHQHRAQLGPTVQQPATPLGRRLQSQNESRGVIRITHDTRPGGIRRTDHGKQPCTQLEDFVLNSFVLTRRRLEDVGGQPVHMGLLDPVELPRSPGGPLDQVSLDLVARIEIGGPIVDPPSERVGILTRQGIELGGHAVRDGIEPRPAFAFLGPWPSAFLSVPAIGFNLAVRGHGSIDFSKDRVFTPNSGVRRGPARTAESSRSQNCLIKENDAEKAIEAGDAGISPADNQTLWPNPYDWMSPRVGVVGFTRSERDLEIRSAIFRVSQSELTLVANSTRECLWWQFIFASEK